MSLPLSVCSLVNCAFWFTYCVMIDDILLGLPNGIGGVLALVTLGLKAIYPAVEVPDNNKLEEIEFQENVVELTSFYLNIDGTEIGSEKRPNSLIAKGELEASI
eukprot:Pgem_evm1s3785